MMLIFSSLMDVVEIQSLVDVVEIQLSARSVDSMHSSLPFLFCPQTSKVSVPKLAPFILHISAASIVLVFRHLRGFPNRHQL